MKQSRNALMGLLVLSAAVAMPMAFAQEQDQKAADPAAATQSDTQTTDTAPQEPATTEQPAAQASTDTAKPKTWADVDGDKDGNISKTEAASEPAVGQIFEAADSNKDSKLTPDEYKAYVAKANGAKPAGPGG